MKKTRQSRRDFLTEMIDESTRKDSRFPELLATAREQRIMGERVAARRHRLGLSQTDLAKRMASTQRIVSKIENGGDVNISTLHRCLAALGLALRVVAGGQGEHRLPKAG